METSEGEKWGRKKGERNLGQTRTWVTGFMVQCLSPLSHDVPEKKHFLKFYFLFTVK